MCKAVLLEGFFVLGDLVASQVQEVVNDFRAYSAPDEVLVLFARGALEVEVFVVEFNVALASDTARSEQGQAVRLRAFALCSLMAV